MIKTKVEEKQAIPLFPRFVAVFDIGTPDKEQLEWMKSCVTATGLENSPVPVEEQRAINSSYGSNSSFRRILNEERMSDCHDIIMECVEEYNESFVGYDIQDWVFSQTWVSCKRPGESHVKHHHPNSIISGVWFFDEEYEDSTSDLHIIDPLAESPSSGPVLRPPINFRSTAAQNGAINDQWAFKPFPGALILFPSQISHNVPPNNTDKDRYSLALNTMPKGLIGDHNSLTGFDYRWGL